MSHFKLTGWISLSVQTQGRLRWEAMGQRLSRKKKKRKRSEGGPAERWRGEQEENRQLVSVVEELVETFKTIAKHLFPLFAFSIQNVAGMGNYNNIYVMAKRIEMSWKRFFFFFFVLCCPAAIWLQPTWVWAHPGRQRGASCGGILYL